MSPVDVLTCCKLHQGLPINLLRSPGEVVASLLHSMQVAFRNTMHKINRCATRRTNQRMENIIKSTSKVYHTDIIWQWTHLDDLQSHVWENKLTNMAIFSKFSLTKPPLGRHDGCHFYHCTWWPHQHRHQLAVGNPPKVAAVTLWIQETT